MRKRNKNLGEKIFRITEDQTDMSPISLADMPYIEISGQNHIEIEGIYKLIECSPEIIKMQFKKKMVCFRGDGLYIHNFEDKNAVIKGKVLSVEFE